MSVSGIIAPNEKIYDILLPNPYPYPAQANDLASVLVAGNQAGSQDIIGVNNLQVAKVDNPLLGGSLIIGGAGQDLRIQGATTKGSLLVGDGTSTDELVAGANGLVLTTNSAAPLGLEWAVGGGGVASVSAGNNITVSGTVANPVVALSSPLTTQVDMGNLKIVNCLDPTANQDVATKNYTDGKVGSVSAGNNITIGGTPTAPTVALSSPITSQIDMGNLKIVNCLDPTAAQDVATKNYTDGKVGSVSAGNNITIGGTLTAPTVALSSPLTTQLDMGSLKIVNCLNPTSNQDVATKNYVDTQVGGSVSPLGTGIQFYMNSPIPTNYLVANGQAVSRTTYSSLFSLMGTTYGQGDGTTTFNLPSLTINVQPDIDLNYNPNVENGQVTFIVLQSDGKAIIGGEFTSINGTARNYIARLNTDGSLDTTYNPNANSYCYGAAIQSDGKAIIGGNFTTMGGTARNRVARLNTDGSLDTTYNPNADGGNVFAIAIQSDGKAIVGGLFTTMGGTSLPRIARLNTDGSLDTIYNPNPTNGYCLSIAIQADGKAIVGGAFTTFTATGTTTTYTRNRIARLGANPTATIATIIKAL